ncbi:MAG: hypothetical protein ACKPJD_16545, partial [Planctomycetaceae bacterium]
MPSCSDHGSRLPAGCRLSLSLLLLITVCVLPSPEVQAQQTANSPAAMPEQIRQLLARAVAAMDRNDP